jgi:hypothetical protein
MKKYYITLLLALFFLNVFSTNFWNTVSKDRLSGLPQQIAATKASYLRLNAQELDAYLRQAPLFNFNHNEASNVVVELPLPGGGFESFKIFNAPIMDDALATQYPDINTYMAISSDGASYGRIDYTYKGFHAMIFTLEGTFFIDPYTDMSSEFYISYFRKYFVSNKEVHPCLFEDEHHHEEPDSHLHDHHILDFDIASRPKIGNGTQLRTYRLAVAATGEYTIFHGGTVAAALSAIVSTINRVNGVYERDMSIRMILVGNNDAIIYTNPATDPYTNGDAGAMINQNQTNLNNVIGSANYDIGHVFGTNSGGLAQLGSVCSNNNKARGVTGGPAPVGDPFDIDYVAHEIGHQFGAGHTFNTPTGSCGQNRSNQNAYEPGSGSTIMAYAGLCGAENIQNQSNDYFHVESYRQIYNFAISGNGNNCANRTNTGNNIPQITSITPTNTYTIPKSTPFELKATATDPDGDVLTYCWEQFDRQNSATAITNPTGNQPLFRSFSPVEHGVRVFPKWSDILNNTSTIGERLPDYGRDMTFRLLVRDNRPGAGAALATNFDQTLPPSLVKVTVSNNAGPFLVTNPNTANVSWSPGQTETITWNVAGTTANGVNCNAVDIYLSIDGGQNFNILLAEGVPNNGSTVITVPAQNTAQARVMVRCANNIFFDVSDANFTIEFNCSSVDPQISINSVSNDTTICVGDNLVLSVNATSPDLTLSYQWIKNGVDIQGQISSTFTINNAQTSASGVYSCRVSNICNQINTSNIGVQVSSRPATPLLLDNGGQLVSDWTGTNQWYLNGQVIEGATNFIYDPVVSGVYTVSSVMNNCPSLPSNAIEIIIASLKQVDAFGGVSVYPNPSNGNFTIEMKEFVKDVQLEIFNLIGKVVYSSSMNSSVKEVNVSNLPKGAYFIKLHSEELSTMKKIVINQ